MGGLNVWDIRGEQPRRRALLHKGELCYSLALSPDGKRLACGVFGGISLWDVTAAEPRRLEKLDIGYPTAVCFTPDGQRLMWGDLFGRLVLWDFAVQGLVREWKLPGRITQVAVSRDGRHIFTYNGNGTIYVLRLASQPASVQLPEPPPLTEWLKGRKVLTVVQDGSGQFKTIQAALNALKPGQVVKVLDRGPYRERLSMWGVPEDTGLISEQQTVLELSEWLESKKNPLIGHTLGATEGFRVHGFAWIFPTNSKGVSGYCLSANELNGFVLENCLFQIKGELKEVAILGCRSDADAKPVWVRDCMFHGKLTFVSRNRSAIAVAERNYFDDTGDSQALFVRGDFTKVVLRHNVFGERVKGAPIGVNDMKEVDALEVRNNTTISAYPLAFGFSAPRKNVAILNNLRSQPGSLVMGEGPEKELPAIVENWQMGHNTYPRQLRQGEIQYILKQNFVPQAPTDVLGEPKFLSLDRLHADYLRIAADSPPAKGGAGGAWPSYIGALPPGPAPKDGDWFTRLREKWRNDKPAAGK